MSRCVGLPGLIGSNPLGALASFGLLRTINEWDRGAKLGFKMEDDWVAYVETQAAGSAFDLIQQLARWVRTEPLDRALAWADDVRVPVDHYRNAMEDALSSADPSLAHFLTALAADGAVDGQKALIKPSAFYMVSGQQSFLGGMRDILTHVRLDPESAFSEALVGPWRYQTPLHSLGWDPNTERLYALRARAPTSEKPYCVAPAVLLAFWSLPLFPVVSKRGRAQTTGFVRRNGYQSLAWPIFSAPIDLGELRSLIHAGEGAWRSFSGGLRTGIESVFRSRRAEFGQGYAVLRNALGGQRALSD